MTKEDTRPVFINLLRINLPITGIVSILHRISGFILFFIFPFLVWLLDRSLGSESSYLSLLEDINSNLLIKVGFSIVFMLLVYHLLAGIKKLLGEFFGIGETLSSTKITSWSTVVIFFFILFLFIGVFWF